MGETKSNNPPAEDVPAAARTRDEQATSGKTLSDLERTQADPATATTQGGDSSSTSSPVEGSSPAPDGGAEAGRGGRADGSDTGGPM